MCFKRGKFNVTTVLRSIDVWLVLIILAGFLMRRTPPLRFLLLIAILFACTTSRSQLIITGASTAQELAQKLVGTGVTISNVSFTGSFEMAGFFEHQGGTGINIDSGLVLTSGRAIARSP